MSPFTSLSRTLAHEASLVGTILMPYFLSNSMTEAITTEAQSVRGMKPTFTSFFPGASEPAAQAALRTAAGTRLMTEAPAASLRNLRRVVRRRRPGELLSSIHVLRDVDRPQTKRALRCTSHVASCTNALAPLPASIGPH